MDGGLGWGYDVGEGLEGLWVSERFSEVCIDICFDSAHCIGVGGWVSNKLVVTRW